jgi:chromosome segregation ATPase
LKKSHEQEKRLVKKCRELNSEIVNNQSKIKTAVRLSQEDQKTIADLQKEMEKTWKLVYQSQEKESRASETINALKDELINLSNLVEQGAVAGADNELIVRNLRKVNEDLKFQVDDQGLKIINFERTIQHYQKINADLQTDAEKAASTVSEISEQLTMKEKDLARQNRKNEKIQKELDQLILTNEDIKKNSEKLHQEIKGGKQTIADLTQQLKDSKNTTQKYLKEYETLFLRSNKVSQLCNYLLLFCFFNT